MMTGEASTEHVFDRWKRQIDETAQSWARLTMPFPAVGDGRSLWQPVLDLAVEHWARVFAQIPVTPDLMGQWKQILDQCIEACSRALGEVMKTEEFAQLLGRTLDQWLVAQRPLTNAAKGSVDAGLQALNLPSRSELAAVAEQLVHLEDRIDGLDARIEAVLAKASHSSDTLAPRRSDQRGRGRKAK